MTPQQLTECRQWFGAVDRDRSGHIDAGELQKLSFGGNVFKN